MADKKVTLTLGGFVFPAGITDLAMPEKITATSRQSVVSHDLVGGVRIVDAMGAFDEPINWSGIFNGPDALKNARQLATILRLGVAVPLTFSTYAYSVVVSEWAIDFERPYHIPYRIVCTVVSNNPQQATTGQNSDINSLIKTDMNALSSLGSSIAGLTGGIAAGLTGAISTLQGAISTVSTFASASQSLISGVLGPLAAVQAQVKTLISSVGNATLNITTLGGILPNNPISTNAGNLISNVANFTQLPLLLNLQSVAGRMGANLGAVNGGIATLPTAGGNLMQIATAQYSDASQWTTIARANGLTDPMLSGLKTLVIPPASTNQANGGVLVS